MQQGTKSAKPASFGAAQKTAQTSGEFLRSTSEAKSKSNAIEIPSISLPKGGGAIKDIDEKFTVNAINGTSSFSIQIPASPARGVTPSLSLSYNSGAGNGIFGLGWNLGLSSIKRKTDKGLPQYLDSVDSDTFLFSEAEDLVPVLTNHLKIDERTSPNGDFLVRFYRPRIEGLFARIERWTRKADGEIKWRVITRDNITTLFGWSAGSRIADPENPERIYEWLPEFVFDDKGNCCSYQYKAENAVQANAQTLHNKNRFDNAGNIRYSNRYLEKILYGNKDPYGGLVSGVPATNDSDYLFKIFFDYTENTAPIERADNSHWTFRDDAFSDYKAGFEIRTTRLCQRVLLFHQFKGSNEYDGLVKSMEFGYDQQSTKGEFTFLKKITSTGHIKTSSSTILYTSKSLPPIEFEYQAHAWSSEVKTILAEDLVHAPVGLDELTYQFTDLFNEGLSGILTEQANAWYYKRNLGNGKFEQAKLVSPKPSFAGLGGQLQLLDLDGDGGKQLVNYSAEPKGFFELTDEEEWTPYKPFRELPNINIGGGHARMLDLNGDGKAEVLLTEDNAFTWYESEGRKGFAPSRKTIKPTDEDEGPHVVFADSTQSIFLADMSGDGLTDIVRIRNGSICYWPNLGYGKFGRKVCMDNAPLFDHPDAFNPNYIKLADIDGSGTTDIMYLGKNKFSCWLNRSGNSFLPAPEFEMAAFPEIHSESKVTVTDILGNGVACIVWSSALAKDAHAPLRYIDLMGSKKPHVMTRYKNNIGKEVTLEYKPSTFFYLEDKKAGRPWVNKLHFPVHCLSKVVTEDKISGYHFTNLYKYHHGYYDHAEREFRGFGMVEQFDEEKVERWLLKTSASNLRAENESLHQPTVHAKTWAHTGAFNGRATVLNQFSHEYWYEEMDRQGFTVTHSEHALPDALVVDENGNVITGELDAQDWQEALRACKGMTLRTEVFADDTNRQKALTPYTVATHNCIIQRLQPRGDNKHAVFLAKESEAITYNYERNIDDPRVAHTLNIKFDELGNILETAAIAYPRKSIPVPSDLPRITEDAQKTTYITYTQNSFTRAKGGATPDIKRIFDATLPDAYRLRMPCETRTFELTRVKRTGDLFTKGDFHQILSDAKSEEKEYHKWEDDPSITPTDPKKAFRRLIEHVRTLYRDNDLITALPLGELDSMAIPHESYQLAYTPMLLTETYSAKADAVKLEALRLAGKFENLGGSNWWVRSGTTNFIDTTNPLDTIDKAKARFLLPISYTDPFGSITKVEYDSRHLFVKKTIDALLNETKVTVFNYRTLSPQQMKDINDNLSEVITDELGLVKAMAVKGKGLEADDLVGLNEETESEQNDIDSFFNVANASGVCDSGNLHLKAKGLLQHATARFVYDFDVYQRTGKPAVVASIVRETHYRKENGTPSKLQLSFEYTNGLGQVIMKKAQAEPGDAKEFTIGTNGVVTITDRRASDFNPHRLRWIGNGRTILNNKGNPIKQYEPFFSVSPKFEAEKELVETGVTPLMHYDALSRLVKTEMPDGSFSKIEFDSWKQLVYDANDTVKDSEWYKKRTDTTRTDYISNTKEQAAATKASNHYNTPTQLHFDTLGRPVLQIENNSDNASRDNKLYATKIILDIEGNMRSVIDARDNTVMQYQYDMLGNQVYQNSMDAGLRWQLINVLGKPLRTWDERNHEFQYLYDEAQRPAYSKVIGGDRKKADGSDDPLDHVFDRIFYGETLLTGVRTDTDRFNEATLQLNNVLGQVIKHYDTGGLVDTPDYDFKGKPNTTTRHLFKNYKEVANWTDANLATDLEPDPGFTFTTKTDALGRITEQTAPDGSIITPSYNEAGLLNSEEVSHPGIPNPAVYIKDIDYNEKGQRNKIIYGNDVATRFEFDKETFRLQKLESKRLNGELLQEWQCTYDPVGNITHIEDKVAPVEFFKNSAVSSLCTYTYDALYRLTEATGRENNAALNFGTCDNWNDKSFLHALNPNDPMAVRNYTQRYRYDAVGNIMEMRHLAQGGNWTRGYEYETTNNRLKRTFIGDNGSPANYTHYRHHARHGYIEELPHLEKIGWNFKEEVVLTTRQRCTDDNIPVITYYQYDASGQRLRKITEGQAVAGGAPPKKEERIYVAGYELYRKHTGTHAGLTRGSLSLMDKGHRFVMIETRNDVNDGTEKHLVRYQLHNHLGSAALELDNTSDAKVISYEEYHPYGTTSYQAVNKTIKSAAKRYRYTGMERDEETGLEYHSARYYLPWLGRWLSSDPIGIQDGKNLFLYVRSNPISATDSEGKAGKESIAKFGDIARYSDQGSAIWEDGVRISEHEHVLPRGKLEAVTFDAASGSSDFTDQQYRSNTTLTIERETALDKTHANRGGVNADNAGTKRLKAKAKAGQPINYREEVFNESLENMKRAAKKTNSVVTDSQINKAALTQDGELFGINRMGDTGKKLNATAEDIDKAIESLDFGEDASKSSFHSIAKVEKELVAVEKNASKGVTKLEKAKKVLNAVTENKAVKTAGKVLSTVGKFAGVFGTATAAVDLVNDVREGNVASGVGNAATVLEAGAVLVGSTAAVSVIGAFGAGYGVGTLLNDHLVGGLIDKAAPGSGALGDWYYRTFLK